MQNRWLRGWFPSVVLGVLTVLSATSASSAQTIVYVDASATGSPHNGSSWCNGYLDLHSALTAANSGTTLRIANGVYRPNPTGLPDPRSATFTLKNGVTLEGGYAGCGASNPNLRDLAVYATVLSGDVADNDPGGNAFRDCCHSAFLPGCPDAACSAAVCAVHPFCCSQWEEICAEDAQTLCSALCQTGADNSYHVVTASGLNATAILDGVTITEGKADFPTFGSLDAKGGGLHTVGGSPAVRWCRFMSNDALVEGGGAYLENSTSLFSNCRFEDNRSRNYFEGGGASGGGVAGKGGNLYFADCDFHANMTDGFGAGAGLLVRPGTATLVRASFTDNLGAPIDTSGGILTLTGSLVSGNFAGIRLSGQTVIRDSTIVRNYGAGVSTQGGTLSVMNCLISGNFGGSSGAGMNLFGGVTTVKGCTIVGNTANSYAGGIYAVGNVQVEVVNSVIWGNEAQLGSPQIYTQRLSSTSIPHVTVSYCDVEGGQAGVLGTGILTWGSGNIVLDPLVVDADGLDAIPGNEDDDLRLQRESPCVDAGDNSVMSGVVSDLDGNARILDGNSDGVATVDMGAYELQRPIPAMSSRGFAILFGLILIVGAVLIRTRVSFLWDAFSRRISMRNLPPPPPMVSILVLLTSLGAWAYPAASLGQEFSCEEMEVDPETFVDPEDFPPPPTVGFGPGGPAPGVCTDDGTIIDVLVLYTPLAKAHVAVYNNTSPPGPIEDVIALSIVKLNEAFLRSQIPTYARLVGSSEVPYDESSDTTQGFALGCLKSSTCMPLARFLRDRYKADLVTLLIAPIHGPTIGLADRLGAFNIVQVDFAESEGLWVFTHEIGHNLGAGHQGGGSNPRAWCHGYEYANGNQGFRTVMTISPYTKILNFSNPNVLHEGVPTGVNNTANNARCIGDFLRVSAMRKKSDCNLNGICDSLDIANATSADCEHNGIPDECYDSNGPLGGCCVEGVCSERTQACCLFAGGTFTTAWCLGDYNANGIPDSCDSPIGACCYISGCWVQLQGQRTKKGLFL